MDQYELEDPLPDGALTIGLIYNLKKGIKTDVIDEEAEYDSIETITAIKSALASKGHNVVLLEADKALPEKLRNTQIDIAFNIAEGLEGRCREAQVPVMLDFFGIPYTGSDSMTLLVALDKALAKNILSPLKIRTPKFALFNPGDKLRKPRLQYPAIIKPNAEGSSKGISDNSIAKSYDELREILERNFRMYNCPMIAEEYIDGREFTVGVLGNKGDMRVFPPMEIIFRRKNDQNFNIYSYNVKQNYKEYIEYKCPANLTPELEKEMVRMSETIFKALGCRDSARIDYRMSEDGKIYFLEINPLPGLAPGYSDYPMLAESSGVGYVELINGILSAALKRLGMVKRGEPA